MNGWGARVTVFCFRCWRLRIQRNVTTPSPTRTNNASVVHMPMIIDLLRLGAAVAGCESCGLKVTYLLVLTRPVQSTFLDPVKVQGRGIVGFNINKHSPEMKPTLRADYLCISGRPFARPEKGNLCQLMTISRKRYLRVTDCSCLK